MDGENTQNSLDDAIRRAAGGPKSAEADGQRVEQHSLSDLVKADRYLASKEAAKSQGGGIRFRKMIHSGA